MARAYQRISLGGTEFRTLREPAPQRSDESDVTWRKTPGGKGIPTLWSPTLKRRGYRVWLVVDGSPDDLTLWETFIATTDNFSTTFTMIDHRNETFTARFLADPVEVDDDAGDILIDCEFLEVRS